MTRAVYIRTSMRDQHGDAQRHELAKACEARGWTDAVPYTDQGVSSRVRERPALESLRKMAAHGSVREVMISKLDRLGRSVIELDELVRFFDASGCRLVFLHDSIDTQSASGRLLFHVLSAVAEFERDRIHERVLEGIAAARAKGVRFGRPPGGGKGKAPPSKDALLLAQRSRASGASWAQCERLTGVPVSTLRRVLRACQKST